MPDCPPKQALTKLFQQAAFITSVYDPAQLPSAEAEVAIAGRSNSGKSSAINALTGQRRLAHVSKTPGRTQALNFFSLGPQRFLVDLPGYGYAAVPAEERRRWEKLISTYIRSRAPLRGVICVMDVRHALSPLDASLLDWIRPHGLKLHILLNKADKLSAREARAALVRAERKTQQLAAGRGSLQLFSSKSGQGVEAARRLIAEWLIGNKKPPVKGE